LLAAIKLDLCEETGQGILDYKKIVDPECTDYQKARYFELLELLKEHYDAHAWVIHHLFEAHGVIDD
jgi:hypothetical protein